MVKLCKLSSNMNKKITHFFKMDFFSLFKGRILHGDFDINLFAKIISEVIKI